MAKKIESSEKTVKVVKEMKKIIRSNRSYILWLVYPQEKIFETFDNDNKFIN